MACRYTLLIRYDDNKFYLAPRFSITVEEESDFESINYGDGCCGETLDREWHFKLRFVGNCSLASAYSLFNQLQAFLNQACAAQVDLLLERTVCDETTIAYRISKPRVRMIETISQFTQKRILTMELIVTLNVFVEEGDGVVLVGS